jgi:hypothetical protein
MSIWSLLRDRRTEPQSEVTDPADRTVRIVGTRRNLFKLLGIGAAGAVGASVLEASPASAGTGNGADVQLGQTNTAAASTIVSTSAGSGLYGTINQNPSGLIGELVAGVVGDVAFDNGVIGLSENLNGVYGVSTNAYGVYGIQGTESGLAGDSGLAGVLGDSSENTGVAGVSSDSFGVYGGNGGISGIDFPLAGVAGESSENYGVVGASSAGVGVGGFCSAKGGAGVFGSDQSTATGGGYGVYATSVKGTALQVEGIVKFNRSGVTSLETAGTSVLVTVPGGLTNTSHVLATLQTNHGTLSVRAAVPNSSTGKIAIYFTASAPVGTKVAWFVFG